jgi:hypothetical protein
MTLKEDAKQIFISFFGAELAMQLDNFEDPRKYPKDFLDECTHFLGNLIGMGNAKIKLENLYVKYAKIQYGGTMMHKAKKTNHSKKAIILASTMTLLLLILPGALPEVLAEEALT